MVHKVWHAQQLVADEPESPWMLWLALRLLRASKVWPQGLLEVVCLVTPPPQRLPLLAWEVRKPGF